MVTKAQLGALIAVTAVISGAVTMSFENPSIVYFCDMGGDEILPMECPGGLSGGKHTWCYTDVEKTNHETCSSGWISISELDTPKTLVGSSKIGVYGNGKDWECDFNNLVEGEPIYCRTGDSCMSIVAIIGDEGQACVDYFWPERRSESID